MSSSSENTFSAKEPSLGYYYQVRYSLYLLLLSNRQKERASIRIESLDDIDIEKNGVQELYQTKLHVKSKANLSDRSPDFWKTIRVWSEAIKNGLVNDINNTIFTLVTTSSFSSETFIKKFAVNNSELRIGVLDEMNKIASENGSAINEKGFLAFMALTNVQKENLIHNIYVIDAALSIEETVLAIERELRYSAPVGKIKPFRERIEGWWFNRCIDVLLRDNDSITIRELERKIEDTRDSFTTENLPDDFPNPIDIDENEIASNEEQIFIKQLKLIAIKKNSLKVAISDFRRAFEQRSRWFREELTGEEEYKRFDDKLHDYWSRIFNLMKDECDELSEEELIKVGYKFYKNHFLLELPKLNIRDRFQSNYMITGSCHMLADKKRIGWHPNYKEKLEE